VTYDSSHAASMPSSRLPHHHPPRRLEPHDAEIKPHISHREKLYEELLADDETTTRTPHPKLRIARAREVPDHLLDELLPWLMQHRVLSDEEVRRDLRRWVPEYQSAAVPLLHSLSMRGSSSADERSRTIDRVSGIDYVRSR
jgi:hypothetical protein